MHVRIDRVDLTSPERPTRKRPAPPERARGFAEFALTRRYLDRAWRP